MLFDSVLPQAIEVADQLTTHLSATAHLVTQHAGAWLEEITRSVSEVAGNEQVNGGCHVN
ncbi:hypothetical protein AB0M36_35720 [Actinoplanes sp. NPDC051346]|uniref:hypothetical protein n=1 Tax=Actinoplanes sp. NPDC051346 TaxID=3155048 RepID=UPI0034155FB8